MIQGCLDTYSNKTMAVKVLVTALGQHLIADTKQVENKETNELVGYWLEKPRLFGYSRDEESGDIGVQYMPYCLISDEQNFSIKADHIVAILEARDDVAAKYNEIVNPPETPEVSETELVTTELPDNEPNTSDLEVGAVSGSVD